MGRGINLGFFRALFSVGNAFTAQIVVAIFAAVYCLEAPRLTSVTHAVHVGRDQRERMSVLTAKKNLAHAKEGSVRARGCGRSA